MALDKDAFLPGAFRKVQKIGKVLKSNRASNIAGFYKKKSIPETWKRLQGSQFYVRTPPPNFFGSTPPPPFPRR